MGKFAKVLVGIMALIAVILLGLIIFVRFYLTEDRIRAIIVPPVEKVLARQVSMGEIRVGLLRGITIKDFAIKENDGKTDFIKVETFVLTYDLFALLNKQVKLREARLEKPIVRIHRYQDGKFNFATLAILSRISPQTPVPPVPIPPPPLILPLALIVDQIRVQQAQLLLSDDLGKLPVGKAIADLELTLNLGSELAPLVQRYQGELHLVADLVYGAIKPNIVIFSSFDPNKLQFEANITIDEQQLALAGRVNDYTGSPDMELNISSEILNLEYLAGLAAGLSEAATKPQKAATRLEKSATPATSIAQSLPPGLAARGLVEIGKGIYQGLTINDFTLRYSLQNGLLTIQDLSAQTLGGSIKGLMEADLNKTAVAWQGSLEARSLQLQAIRAVLAPRSQAIIEGDLATSLVFSGKGSEWPMVRETLVAEATVNLSAGLLKNIPIIQTIAGLIGLAELNDYSFEVRDGHLKIAQGRALINSQLIGPELSVKTQGYIGLDGSLNLPLTLRLSTPLSDKLKQRAFLVKYLADDQGQTVIHLKLSGTVDKPSVGFDQAVVRRQVEKIVEEKVSKGIDRVFRDQQGQEGEELKKMLRGLFGR